jgi:glycerol-3-phosphate acyltransferase PlsY
MSLTVLLLVVTAYLIGSVPFALILARRLGTGDLRRIGSGNLGAANVLRTSGVRAGVTVMLLDIAKGVGSVMLVQRFDVGAVTAAAGLAAIVGHVFPVWLRFRGGKGVATACGVFSILTPLAVGPALAGARPDDATSPDRSGVAALLPIARDWQPGAGARRGGRCPARSRSGIA